MLRALRYVDTLTGYWEVRTEHAIEQHTSLRQFQGQNEIALLATRALQQPGVWVEVVTGREQERSE